MSKPITIAIEDLEKDLVSAINEVDSNVKTHEDINV